MKKTDIKSPAMLFLAAFIWGVAFVAQSVGMDYVGPFTFNTVRSIIGGLVLIPCIFFLGKKERGEEKKEEDPKTLLTGGILCGLCLCVASNFQQFGIRYTTVGKAGFITAMYILFVPLGELLIFRKRLRWLLVPAVLLSVTGLYLLCMKPGAALTLEGGDATLLLCAVGFTAHILIIDRVSPRTDGVKLSCVQFAVAAVVSLAMALIAEKPSLAEISGCWVPIVYAGVMSGGIGYTLQIVGQKDTDPTVASLILCLESVFAVLGGWLILGAKMTAREYAGCGMMLIGILLAQWPEKKSSASESIQS